MSLKICISLLIVGAAIGYSYGDNEGHHDASDMMMDYHCTRDHVMNCTYAVHYGYDFEDQCMSHNATKACLMHIHDECNVTKEEEMKIKEDIKSHLLPWMVRRWHDCEMFMAGRSAEHHCNKEDLEKCTHPVVYGFEMATRCRSINSTKDCLMKIHEKCDDMEHDEREIKTKIEQEVKPWLTQMMKDCQLVMHQNDYSCNMEQVEMCGHEVHYGHDLKAQCSAVDSAKECMHKIYMNCNDMQPEDRQIREKLMEEASPWLERKKEDCKSYMDGHDSSDEDKSHESESKEDKSHESDSEEDSSSSEEHDDKDNNVCSHEGLKKCMLAMTKSHMMEDKCRATGPARMCIMGMKMLCEDDKIQYEIMTELMPLLEQEMKKCMEYGHMTGEDQQLSYSGDNQGHYNAVGSVQPSMAALLAILATIMGVMTFKNC